MQACCLSIKLKQDFQDSPVEVLKLLTEKKTETEIKIHLAAK